MSLMAPTAADAGRRRGLRRMRTLALSLLVLAAVVYLATLHVRDETLWGYVNTASEAAMVGALADWFAVTALFRHPLGLPVPHTAIIPKRKDELGRNLQTFVTENFLTEDIARERLAAAQVGRRLGRWLEDPRHRDRVMTEGLRAARAALDRLSDEEVRAFVVDLLIPRLVREPVSPIAGSLLEGVVADGAHHGLVDLSLEQLHQWLEENPGTFHDLMGERAPWWTPPWLDERVISWSYRQVLDWVGEIRARPDHPARIAFDDLLRRLADDLQHDPVVMERTEALKTRLLTHPQVGPTTLSLWRSLRTSITAAMDDRTSYLWRRGDELLTHVAEHLTGEDPAWRDRLESNLADVVSFAVNTYGDELAGVITLTVEHWDGKEAAQRIELFVGRDLQFIRINGTVVGALAGVVIHALTQVFT
ncbi:conserved hypothetical protein [Nostocoides japonicum T1-X7]|uniref:DUF445 domain-containing protein n=1 Tax=Nostocoides japonicum T1-X7 TaxID=1194083 RepID=A0A077LY29_9MICO|nr:DUF445 domain-containing protein [Tetrasphaera japonica]CCH76845.1 conserved hypothetical protein [Tetrasphaera japonica T1-X7]